MATGAEAVTDPIARTAPAGVAVWAGDSPDDPPAARQVVVLGVDRVALVAAEALAQKGAKVTMLAGARKPSWDVSPTFKWRHGAWLKEFGITVLEGAWAERWDKNRLRLRWEGAPVEGGPDALDLDLLVLAGQRKSRQRLVQDLEYRVDVLHTVGDAISPQSCWQAIHSAYRVAAHV